MHLCRGEVVKEVHWVTSSDRRYFGWSKADAERYTSAFTGHLSQEERAALHSRQALALDGTPAICSYESAPRAAAMMPHAKIVLILRVRFCLSIRLLHSFRSYSARALLSIPARLLCLSLPVRHRTVSERLRS